MKTDRREGGRSGDRRAVSQRQVRVGRREPRRGGLGILSLRGTRLYSKRQRIQAQMVDACPGRHHPSHFFTVKVEENLNLKLGHVSERYLPVQCVGEGEWDVLKTS